MRRKGDNIKFMTQEQKDAAWRSLPEEVKEEVCCDYSNALQAHSSDPNNPRIDAHIKFLEEYFGKHNLTATEEDKPRFKVGDCVKVHISNNSVYRKGDVCLVMSVIKDNNGYHYELDRSRAMLISEEFLAPYTEEQEPKEETKVREINVGDIVRVKRETPCNLYNNMPYAFVDMPFFVTEIEVDCDNGLNDVAHLRNGSTYLNIHPHWLQKEDVHHKWEKDGRQEVVDMTLKTWLNSTPDWLAYRMELAKEVVKVVYHHKNPHKDIIDDTMSIVNGIVERLKGGLK